MDVRLSELEEWLTAREGTVDHDLAHSGVAPLLDYGALPAEPALVRALAHHLDVPADEVVVTTGATEAGALALLAALERGETVAVEQPTYPPLADAPRLLGFNVVRFPRRFEEGFAAPAAPVPDARLTTYSSPHNPSGRRVPAEVVARTAEATGGYVLVDEIFREIADDPWPTARKAHPRALAVGSLTKAQGLGGARVGWLLAPPDLARRARAAKNVLTFSVGALEQRLAERALATGLAGRAVALRRANWPLVERTLRALRLEFVAPEAGLCVVVRVAGDDRAVAERLAQAGVLVAPGSAFGLPGTLRVGFGGETARVAAALAAFEKALR